jgi:hypothetical protein
MISPKWECFETAALCSELVILSAAVILARLSS